MRFISCILFAVAIAGGATLASKPEGPETSHLAFVKEYIRELAAIQGLRDSASKDVQGESNTAFLTDAIHFSTMMQLELRSQVAILKGMRLNPPFDKLIPNITQAYTNEIALHQQLIDISSAFIGGPKPGVDYSKLAAEMPQVRAKLDYIDQTLFKVTPMIFATLIDMRGGPNDRADHLLIIKAERAELLDELANDFGSRLDLKDQNYTISSAAALRAALKTQYKCSDDH